MATKTTTKSAKPTETSNPKAEKPIKAKPISKKEEETPKEKKYETGVEKAEDVPWCPKKVLLFRALKALKAVSLKNAQPVKAVLEKCLELDPDSKMTSKNVRHYCYHAVCSGWTLVEEAMEEHASTGYVYCLTSEGAKLDPAKEYARQEQAKSSK